MTDNLTSTGNNDFQYLLKRAVAEIIIEEELIELLRSGKKLRLKEGFDPSAPDIHLGHMVTLRKLRQFQELGHQIVLIVADWTAQIGDPSGASATRKMLTAEQVKANAETYMKQFFKIVDKEKTEVRWQSEWFGKFNLGDIIRLTSKFTVAQFLARDDFNKRFNEGRPIAITEFLYPLLQAYDSVAIQADVEFGGTDQKFNFLVGRELQSMMGQRPQQCFMMPLLVGTDGSQKMSKSLGNYIGVAEPPETIYGKTMSIRDDLILQYFELVTDVPDTDLAEYKKQLDNHTENPMVLKKRLAREIVTQLYGEKEASAAEAHFNKTVQKKELPDEIEEKRIPLNKYKCKISLDKYIAVTIHVDPVGQETVKEVYNLGQMLVALNLAKSNSEAVRLIQQGAVSVDSAKINFPWVSLDIVKSGSIIKAGKRHFIKILNTDQ
jgi:tyrosyl-tRNA synthetase